MHSPHFLETGLSDRGGLMVVGLGARAGTPVGELAEAVGRALAEVGAGWDDVGVLATLDRRAQEEGVRELAAAHGWELLSLDGARLAAQDVPHRSSRVSQAVGTPSVAEAAALAAAGPGGRLILPRTVFGRVVVAVASTSRDRPRRP